MKKTRLKQYARLIAKMGGAVQKGQDVIIVAGLDQPEFVEFLVEECYKQGAARVIVDWDYQPLTRYSVKYQKLERLSTLEQFEIEKWNYRLKSLPVMIYLESDDPDGLSGIDQSKLSKSAQEKMKIIKPIRDQMDNKYQWCIAAVPGKKWAKKMYPGLRVSAAVEKQWEDILKASRAWDGDPIENWKKHNENLSVRCQYLNGLGIQELRYSASNGTDFRVGLMENSCFLAGQEKTLLGGTYNPNIPSEEVFTSPKKGSGEGIVYATKPLSFRGEVIEDFSIRFEKGRAVEVHAKKNEDVLKELIAMDEGASYLGECALVPANSPICESGLLFYNTLFDENAACHLALGRGFYECVKGHENYTLEEMKKDGVNDSMIHSDFMIGTPDLSIDAVCKNGDIVPIFRSGKWAF